MSTLAGDLARALGDVAAMQELYADDISWTLPVTLGRIGGTHRGKEQTQVRVARLTGIPASRLLTKRRVVHDSTSKQALSHLGRP